MTQTHTSAVVSIAHRAMHSWFRWYGIPQNSVHHSGIGDSTQVMSFRDANLLPQFWSTSSVTPMDRTLVR